MLSQSINLKKHAILTQNEPRRDKMGDCGLNCLQALWVLWGNSGYSDAEVKSVRV